MAPIALEFHSISLVETLLGIGFVLSAITATIVACGCCESKKEEPKPAPVSESKSKEDDEKAIAPPPPPPRQQLTNLTQRTERSAPGTTSTCETGGSHARGDPSRASRMDEKFEQWTKKAATAPSIEMTSWKEKSDVSRAYRKPLPPPPSPMPSLALISERDSTMDKSVAAIEESHASRNEERMSEESSSGSSESPTSSKDLAKEIDAMLRSKSVSRRSSSGSSPSSRSRKRRKSFKGSEVKGSDARLLKRAQSRRKKPKSRSIKVDVPEKEGEPRKSRKKRSDTTTVRGPKPK